MFNDEVWLVGPRGEHVGVDFTVLPNRFNTEFVLRPRSQLARGRWTLMVLSTKANADLLVELADTKWRDTVVDLAGYGSAETRLLRDMPMYTRGLSWEVAGPPDREGPQWKGEPEVYFHQEEADRSLVVRASASERARLMIRGSWTPSGGNARWFKARSLTLREKPVLATGGLCDERHDAVLGARYYLETYLVDAAGNRSPLKVITIPALGKRVFGLP